MTIENEQFDIAMCAKWWGYKWEEFEDLPLDMQIRNLAVYRTSRQIDAVLVHEQHKKQKRAARKK